MPLPPTATRTPARLRRYLWIFFAVLSVGVVVLAMLGSLVAPSAWLDSAIVACSAALVAVAIRMASAGRVVPAAVLLPVAILITTLGTTFVTPLMAPINVAASLLPLALIYDYLPRSLLPSLSTLCAVGAALVIGIGEWRRLSNPPMPDTLLTSISVSLFGVAIAGIFAMGLFDHYTRFAKQNAELANSRLRIAAAADEARRRIERDLHDGGQQRLVAVSVRLGIVERQIRTDPDAAIESVRTATAQLKDALNDLREIARGIYPPLLSEAGLAVSIPAVVCRSLTPGTVDIEKVDRYSPVVEAAVYFCLLEAMQNVDKHARASAMTVRIDGGDDLVFAVADDGVGFVNGRDLAGAGMQNMRDRIGAAGGMLTVTSEPGIGTTVRGSIPNVRPR